MSDKRKIPVTAETVSVDKKPHAAEKTESYFHKSPSWRFAKADNEHHRWSVLDSHEDVVCDPNDPTDAIILHKFSRSIDKTLLDCLKDRESTTWSVLMTQSGGRTRGTNSHHIPIHSLIKEAQHRADELGIVEDELFSLRLDGIHRVFGVLDEEGALNVIWFDRKHEICPPAK